jgi:hypothetical protein
VKKRLLIVAALLIGAVAAREVWMSARLRKTGREAGGLR